MPSEPPKHERVNMTGLRSRTKSTRRTYKVDFPGETAYLFGGGYIQLLDVTWQFTQM